MEGYDEYYLSISSLPNPLLKWERTKTWNLGDKSAIEGNIQRAMFLSDRSAYEHYSDLAEQGYYNRIISGNVSQRIEVDSINCNFNHYPYEVVTYARLSIIREKSITERSLVTKGRLLNSTRSDNNPHGFIFEAFRVVENKDLRVYDR